MNKCLVICYLGGCRAIRYSPRRGVRSANDAGRSLVAPASKASHAPPVSGLPLLSLPLPLARV